MAERLSILVISKDLNVGYFIREELQSEEGVTVNSFRTTKDARVFCKGEKIDAIVVYGSDLPNFADVNIPVIVLTEEDRFSGRVEIDGLVERAGVDELPNILEDVHLMVGRRRIHYPLNIAS